MQISSKIEEINIIIDSLSEYIIFKCYKKIEPKKLVELCNKINWKEISDNTIIENKGILNYIKCHDYIDSNSMLRILVKDFQNIHKYPVNMYEYEADHVMKSLRVEPLLIDHLKIKNLTAKHLIELSKTHSEVLERIDFENTQFSIAENIELLKLGNDLFFDKIKISNEEKIDFKDKDVYQILKAYNFSNQCISFFNIKNFMFDNKFYIREFLQYASIECFWLVDHKKLEANDWIHLVKQDLNFLKYLIFDSFIEADPFYFVELCIYDHDYLQHIYVFKHKITSYGWERLFSEFGLNELLLQNCDIESLEERTKNMIHSMS